MDQNDNIANDKFVTGIRKTLTDNGDCIHFVLFVEQDKELFYVKASLTTGSSTVAERIFTNIVGVGETVFIDGATETVGSMSDVRQSFTVGWSN